MIIGSNGTTWLNRCNRLARRLGIAQIKFEKFASF
ncbi:Uncharacterised protein [Vibrio cholerae]|nr:Uncharacterised protein [Vibrio cholerae]